MIKIESTFSNIFTYKVTRGHQNDDDTGTTNSVYNNAEMIKHTGTL